MIDWLYETLTISCVGGLVTACGLWTLLVVVDLLVARIERAFLKEDNTDETYRDMQDQ